MLEGSADALRWMVLVILFLAFEADQFLALFAVDALISVVDGAHLYLMLQERLKGLTDLKLADVVVLVDQALT